MKITKNTTHRFSKDFDYFDENFIENIFYLFLFRHYISHFLYVQFFLLSSDLFYIPFVTPAIVKMAGTYISLGGGGQFFRWAVCDGKSSSVSAANG